MTFGCKEIIKKEMFHTCEKISFVKKWENLPLVTFN